MLIKHQKDHLYCVQLTDTHLFANPLSTLLGIPTEQGLELIIQLIKKQSPTIDLILVTGDIAQEPYLETYQRFQILLNKLNAPSLWAPGNHDNFSILTQAESFKAHLHTEYNLGEHWKVIMLNTQVIGKSYGKITNDQLEQLQYSLATSQRFHLIGMHHPIFSINAQWLNAIKTKQPNTFLDTIKKAHHVKAVLCGHIHQSIELYYQGTHLLSTPSTCIQFANSGQQFTPDNKPPGYRWIKLFANGAIETGIQRLQHFPYQVDSTASTY